MPNELVTGNDNIGPISVSKQGEDQLASFVINMTLLDDPYLQAAQLISQVGIDGVDAFGYNKELFRGSPNDKGTIDQIMSDSYAKLTNSLKITLSSEKPTLTADQLAAFSTGFSETYPKMFPNECFAGHFGMLPINQGPPLSLCQTGSTSPTGCCPDSSYYNGYYDYFNKNYELYKTNNITTPDYFNSNLLEPGKSDANAQKARYIILLGLIIIIVLAMIFTVMVTI